MVENKYKKLALSILFDALGMVSFIIPGVGEFSDIIWAPLAGWLMIKMYKGTEGKAAGLFTLVEEAIPGLDFIPSFSIMWVYMYVIKKEKVQDNDEEVIEVDPS